MLVVDEPTVYKAEARQGTEQSTQPSTPQASHGIRWADSVPCRNTILFPRLPASRRERPAHTRSIFKNDAGRSKLYRPFRCDARLVSEEPLSALRTTTLGLAAAFLVFLPTPK